jgi:dihydroorotase-like cyclic amidohydrolase
MKEAGKIDVDEFFSKAKYSPFDGQKVTGCIDKVILRGRTVYEEREIISKKGYGRPIIKSTQ